MSHWNVAGKGSLKCASLFFDIQCVPGCVVFRSDQRAKSTSWAVIRVASRLPGHDSIQVLEKQTSLPSHLLATWRLHFFRSTTTTVPTLSTLLAEFDCTIKGKTIRDEAFFFIITFFWGVVSRISIFCFYLKLRSRERLVEWKRVK